MRELKLKKVGCCRQSLDFELMSNNRNEMSIFNRLLLSWLNEKHILHVKICNYLKIFIFGLTFMWF
jgi:hypothetical protein